MNYRHNSKQTSDIIFVKGSTRVCDKSGRCVHRDQRIKLMIVIITVFLGHVKKTTDLFRFLLGSFSPRRHIIIILFCYHIYSQQSLLVRSKCVLFVIFQSVQLNQTTCAISDSPTELAKLLLKIVIPIIV